VSSDEKPQRTKKRRRKKKRKKRKRNQVEQVDRVDALIEHQQEVGYEVLRHQRLVGLGATIAIVGLALVGTHDSKVGSSVVIVGLLLLMWSVHRFGRLGTERVRPSRKRPAN
jgi:hypothetical protein